MRASRREDHFRPNRLAPRFVSRTYVAGAIVVYLSCALPLCLLVVSDTIGFVSSRLSSLALNCDTSKLMSGLPGLRKALPYKTLQHSSVQ